MFVAFVFFLLSAALKNNINGVSGGIITEASMETSPVLLTVLKDDRKLISSIALLSMGLSLRFKEACFCLLRDLS